MTPQTFEAFFADTFSRMVARATVLCGHRSDAEDAVAEAYAAAFVRWQHLKVPEAWVYTVVQRRLWRVARLRSRETELPDWLLSDSGPEQDRAVREILEAVAGLPPRQRMVLVLQCLHGLSQEEIRQQLGIRSRSTVAAHLFKARRTLERVLQMTPTHTCADDQRPIRRDEPLMAPLGRVRPSAHTWEDPLAAPLRAAIERLRVAIEDDPDALVRLRGRIEECVARPWWRRLFEARP